MPTKQSNKAKQPETGKWSRKKYKEMKKREGKGKAPPAKTSQTQHKNRTGRTGAKPDTRGNKISEKTHKTSDVKAKTPSETNSAKKGGVRTRKEQKKQQKAEKKANKRPVRRIFPIWLRLIVIPVLCAIALLLGAMVGYGVLGDGSPKDALRMDTWQHIIDIVNKK